MTEEQKDTYKMRITQAGVADYLLILLEMEMQWIEEGLVFYEQKEIDGFLSCVEKAQSVQQELMNLLNLENVVAMDVYSVFVYINKQLINAKIKRTPLDINRCKDLLMRYHNSFSHIAESDHEGPIMAESEKVYAGLTYGSSGLVENSIGGTEYKV